MEPKILGFVDAMRLVSLLTPHLPEIAHTTSTIEVVQSIVTRISPMEFLEVVKLLAGKDISVTELSGIEYATLISEGLIINNILLLMETYKKFFEEKR